MKRLALAVLMLVLPLFAFAAGYGTDRKSMIEGWTAEMRVEAEKLGRKFNWVIEDTGKDFDGGFGDGPVLSVTIPGSHQCLIALHPTERASGILGCGPLEEDTGAKKQEI